MTGVSILFVVATLAACGGGEGGDGGGSTAAPPGGGAATKAWGTAALIETDNAGTAALLAGDAGGVQIAFDASGSALAVWSQVDVGCACTTIWSNRYTAGTGWGTAAPIETNNAGHASGPQIAFDASGNALAVWRQFGGTRYEIRYNLYTAGTGWGAAALIETDNAGNARNPQIAINASGNAVAVWLQDDGTRHNMWSNRYTAGTGWGTPVLIETDNTGGADGGQIAIDASGNALAVWYQSDGVRAKIWSNRYTAGTGWGTAALIQADNAGSFSGNPQIAIDPSGNALAVWYQSDGAPFNIWSNRYTAGTGWGTAALIETDNAGGAADPQIAIDANGNALAVWTQSDGTRTNMWSNRYTAGTGWGTPVLIETDNTGGAGNGQIAIDASGSALAVWEQWDGPRLNIWSNRYTAGTGWGTAALIGTDNAGDNHAPQIAVDANGNALAVWTQWDGTRDNVWANRFQ